MNSRIVDLDEARLKECLDQIYLIQKENCMPDRIMPAAMERLSLDDEGAIDLIESFIRLGWINTRHIKEKFFLRPGFVRCFPVVLSAGGLEKIR